MDASLMLEKAWAYGENIVGALILLIAGLIIMKWLGGGVRKALSRKENMDQQIVNLTVKFVKIGVFLITLVAVLGRFGVETASIIAVLGGLGLAVGLALQGSLSNVAAGVMLLLLRPFKIGEVVKLAGTVYIVDDIGLFVTAVHQPDGPRVWLPNNQVWGSEIVNMSRFHDDVRRHDEIFGIGYDDDIDKAMDIIKEVISADSRILKDPEPLLAVQELGDSSVNILCRTFTEPADWFQTTLDIRKAVKQAFDAQGISIPYPQRDIHLYQTSTSA